MASNRSKMEKFAGVRADMANPQPQQMDVDAHDNSTAMTQLIQTSEPVEATPDPTELCTLATKDQLTLESTNWLGTIKAQCSLNNGKTLAQFHPDRSGYLLAPEVFAQKGFSMERVTIEHGNFKGHQALVLVPLPKKAFDFFGLPPEIRIMIYELLLTKPDHVIVIQGGKTRGLRGGFLWNARAWVRYESRGHRHNSFATLPIATEILQTSRQVHNEATAILYGSNTFTIMSGDISCGFLDSIGTNKALLQNIEIWAEQNNYFRRRFSRLTKCLPKAKDLKRLELRIFGHLYTRRWGNGSDLFQALKPLLKTLHDREKDVEKVIKILEFHVSQPRCAMCDNFPSPKIPCTFNWCIDNRALFKDIVTEFEACTRNYLNFGPERRNTGRPKRTTARDIDYSLFGDDE